MPYRLTKHSLCSGTGWLSTPGSGSQMRCNCNNGLVLQRHQDLIDTLREIAKTTSAPIPPHGWKIGEKPTPEEQ